MNGILSYTVKTGDKKLLAFVQFSRGTSVLNQPVMGVYSMWKSWSAIKDLKSSLMSKTAKWLFFSFLLHNELSIFPNMISINLTIMKKFKSNI